jgi:hypothetical protein
LKWDWEDATIGWESVAIATKNLLPARQQLATSENKKMANQLFYRFLTENGIIIASAAATVPPLIAVFGINFQKVGSR